jgi:putative acetyltransferase
MSILIAREDPRAPEAATLIAELDRYMRALYPPASNHLLDLAALAAPDIFFFVAREQAIALGCAALWHRQADYGEVKRLYVRPEARGRGVGRRLLEHLEMHARSSGLPALRLETGTLQPEALMLFAAFGFRRSGPFADYPADDPFSVFMAKPLRE